MRVFLLPFHSPITPYPWYEPQISNALLKAVRGKERWKDGTDVGSAWMELVHAAHHTGFTVTVSISYTPKNNMNPNTCPAEVQPMPMGYVPWNFSSGIEIPLHE